MFMRRTRGHLGTKCATLTRRCMCVCECVRCKCKHRTHYSKRLAQTARIKIKNQWFSHLSSDIVHDHWWYGKWSHALSSAYDMDIKNNHNFMSSFLKRGRHPFTGSTRWIERGNSRIETNIQEKSCNLSAAFQMRTTHRKHRCSVGKIGRFTFRFATRTAAAIATKRFRIDNEHLKMCGAILIASENLTIKTHTHFGLKIFEINLCHTLRNYRRKVKNEFECAVRKKVGTSQSKCEFPIRLIF